MNAIVSRDVVGGFEVFVLENSQVRASVIPSLGGRVWELLDRIRGRQWIWHREDVPLAVSPSGTSYDDVWAGGWEELFPNDAPTDFEGRALPDHGEWWTTPFLWLFLSYGGWRDCYTAVLEPCTNMPKDLAEAVRTGQSARLDAGAFFQTQVATLSAFTPRD
jgi:hypothetical protein